MAMGKTNIDMACRLQIELITTLHGLVLNHVVCCLRIAMCILRYTNDSTPVYLPSASKQDGEFNALVDLPKGTVRVIDLLRCIPI